MQRNYPARSTKRPVVEKRWEHLERFENGCETGYMKLQSSLRNEVKWLKEGFSEVLGSREGGPESVTEPFKKRLQSGLTKPWTFFAARPLL